MKKIIVLVGLLLLPLVILMVSPQTVTAEGQNGTTLSANVTSIVPNWTRTFHWTIAKSVNPSTWDLFRGDRGTSTYTVAVIKDNGTDAAWVSGTITVTNGGSVATTGLQIIAVLRNGASQNAPIIATSNVEVSGNPVLDPGETGTYNYSVNVPAQHIVAGATLRIDADVTITNHSGHLGTPFGPSPAATTGLPASPTLINDSINVDDTNGSSWSFNASGSVNYNRIFTCDADKGTKNNTATIRETKQSSSASVTVNCYALEAYVSP